MSSTAAADRSSTDLIVAPGANPSQIRIELEGAENVSIDEAGNLALRTAAGALQMRRPLVYQETGGVRHEIQGQFALQSITNPKSKIQNPAVAFQLAKYDTTRPLVIDPIFDFTAGFGGTMRDECFGVAAGPGGNIYVTGSTSSVDFPVTSYGERNFPDIDAWIAFLNGDGTQLVASTYFGGSGNDEALAIAVDQFGIAYVTGYTQSEDFPISGSFLRPYGGLGDAFMAAFSLSGASLYALYYGGSGIDQGNGIAAGVDGSVYVSGWTRSTDLPVVNPLQATNAGGIDFFVAKLNPAATALDYATYLGGNNHEHIAGNFVTNSSAPSGGIDVDSAGNAYVTGGTLSVVFPTVNGYRPSGGGVFLSKLNPAGSALSYSSTFGGGSGYGVAAGDDGYAFLTGVTFSETFPTRLAAQPTYGGSGDAFVLGVATTISGDASLVRSTFLGGDGEDEGYGITRFPLAARIAGRTNSTNMPFTFEPSGGSILKSSDGGATWSKANNGLVSASIRPGTAGQVNSVAVDPTNPEIVYAGTESGSVFKTTNGGALWQPMNTGLPSDSISALAVDPTNPLRIYAGTFQSGIYFSDNAGASWTARNTGLQTNAPISSFLTGPQGTLFAASDFNGVFKTTNGGMTWTAMNTGLTDTRVTSLASHPSEPDTILAGTAGRSSPSGIYKTINGGENWSLFNGNLASIMGPSAATDFYISALLIFPGNAQALFALVNTDFERVGGMAKSNDGGQTWTALARWGDPNTDLTLFAGYQARSFVVDPNNPNNILVGTTANSGRGIIRTTNGGRTWSATGSVGTDVNLLSFVNFTGPIYAATTGGNDGFITTMPLDGSAPTTEIAGGTGEDELRTSDEFFDSLFDGQGDVILGGSALSADSLFQSQSPPPNSIPPGPVIPPAEPQNAIVIAKALGAAPSMSADLSVTKQLVISDGALSEVFCSITVRNNGPDTAKNVKLLDHGSNFQTPVTVQSATPSTASPANGNTLTFDLGDIAPAGVKNILLSYSVYASSAGGADLGRTRHNTAQAYMESSEVRDPVVSNDIAIAEVAIPQTPPGTIPPQTANQSTRVAVGTGDGVAISGTIITQPPPPARRTTQMAFVNQGANAKKIIFRAIGPSLQTGSTPLAGRLADPSLELYDSTGAIIGRNDNWRTTQIGGVIPGDNVAAIEASTIPPTHEKESAMVVDLPPGAYTVVVRGAGDSTGIGLAEVYDLNSAGELRLANISTRGLVQAGDNVMIGGVILLGNGAQRIVCRAIGPSLTGLGVAGALPDPALGLFDGNGNPVGSNDNWRSDQEAELIATTVPPSHDAEAAIVTDLLPGAYTAVVSGVASTTGVALVEIYNLGPRP